MADEVVEEQVEEPYESEGIPIVDPGALVYLKLKAWRRKDQEDVVQLLKKGLDDKMVREYLEEIAPDLLEKFDILVSRADDAE